MWSLAEFRFDEAIDADRVYVDLGTGRSELMARDAAIAAAHERGLNLVAWWPGGQPPISCILAKVTSPLRWERAPADDEPIDERLWFEGTCGNRDFIIGNGHTFVGRIAAWCPTKSISYRISLGEIGDMSEESRWYLRGFLAGVEPGWPVDADGDTDEADLRAWRAATRRFRSTGSWYGRWGTCDVCGCVLLPDTAADRCHECV
jgi:hypothetical protein